MIGKSVWEKKGIDVRYPKISVYKINKRTMRIRSISLAILALLMVGCGRTAKKLAKDCERDNWLTAGDALNYGLIDKVVSSRA